MKFAIGLTGFAMMAATLIAVFLAPPSSDPPADAWVVAMVLFGGIGGAVLLAAGITRGLDDKEKKDKAAAVVRSEWNGGEW